MSNKCVRCFENEIDNNTGLALCKECDEDIKKSFKDGRFDRFLNRLGEALKPRRINREYKSK